MPVTRKEVAALVLQFLSSSTKLVDEEYADSLTVAYDCISEAFGIDKCEVEESLPKGTNNMDLASLVSVAISGGSHKQDAKIDPEVVAQADSLKLEGNKAMAIKDYETAVSKYTEAILVLPTNAVFYANRAAAYCSMKKYEDAVKDAKSAVEIDPKYSKGYSRLGFAKYALGEAEEALEAYKKVLDLEGANATEAMKRDYESAKKKVEQSINLHAYNSNAEEDAEPAEENASRSGMPDLSSLLGGGGGGGLGNLLNNPHIMQAAQKMMENPAAMQKMMNNPALKKMAENFTSGSGGGAPNFSEMMNDPSIKEMASKFFGPK